MASVVYEFDDSNISTADTTQIYDGVTTTGKTVAYYARKYCKRAGARIYCNPQWVSVKPNGPGIQIAVSPVGHVKITLDAANATLFPSCDSCSNPGDQQCYEFMKVCKVGDTFTAPSDGTSVPNGMGLETCEAAKSCSLLGNVQGSVT